MFAWQYCNCCDNETVASDEIIQPMRTSQENVELEKQLPHLLARNIMSDILGEHEVENVKDETSGTLDVEALEKFSFGKAAENAAEEDEEICWSEAVVKKLSSRTVQVVAAEEEKSKTPLPQHGFDKFPLGLLAHDGDHSPATPTTAAEFRVASLGSLSSASGPPLNTASTVASAAGCSVIAGGSKADVAARESSSRRLQPQTSSSSLHPSTAAGSGGRQSRLSVSSVDQTLSMASAWDKALEKALQVAKQGSDDFILLESMQEKVWAAQEGLLNARQMAATAALDDDSCRQAGKDCLKLARKQLQEVEKLAMRIRANLPRRRLPVAEVAAASPAFQRTSTESASTTGTWAAPWKFFRQRTAQ